MHPPAADPRVDNRGLLLGYSTNVHRGESLEEVRRSLREYTIPIRKRVFGASPSGLELRIGIGAARELRRPGEVDRLRELLARGKLRLFSINAFPLRDFHGRRVKTNVYRPSWHEPSRARWTVRIAEILAQCLEEGTDGTVSTLGGTYRPWGNGRAILRAIAGGYLAAVEGLVAIEERTGKRILLAVEPEPDTSFESAEDLVRFFEDHLLPQARSRWRKYWSSGRIEAILRRYFTANFDTCHHSVIFRQPAAELGLLRRAGIGVGKIHVSSALALPEPLERPEAYAELRGLDEPRYLHQVRGADRRGKPVFACADLGRLPRDSAWLRERRVRELRSHFHVPIHEASWRSLSTTHQETRGAVELALQKRLCPQLVIETYTWPILAGEDSLVDGIAREFRWLLGVIASARGPS